jgi:radical SAM protein with 4Fe4S-binding SPASM domain
MAGVPELAMGCALREPLEAIWRESSVARRLRRASVADKPQCRDCAWRFLCGGGDIEHGYFFSGSVLGDDPYCDLYQEMIGGAIAEMAAEGAARVGRRGGFARPVLLRTMGERALHCGADPDAPEVATTRSACVLSVDVLQRSRDLLRDFYGRAAVEPQAGLCCPVKPSEEDLSHIPPEVVQRFYGCGSPVADAAIAPGETVVDLGSGAGIDCFVAARRVGPSGRVIGVDMTDEMIDVATRNRGPVARNLGWDVVEFRKGLLEDPPVGTASADVVVSNCVFNLSPDKRRVFAEMWRMLKDGGRVVLSDIVSEDELEPALKVNVHLWGECLSGALSEREFLASLERAGFFAVRILRKAFWKEVVSHRFFSVTVRAFKYEKKQGCAYLGHRAVYLGPLKAVIDEEGHLFPRGEAIEVCTDTAAKLRAPAYDTSFRVLDPDGPAEYAPGCDPAAGCC